LLIFTELPLKDKISHVSTKLTRTSKNVGAWVQTDRMGMWSVLRCDVTVHDVIARSHVTLNANLCNCSAINYRLHDSRLVRVGLLYFTYTPCMACTGLKVSLNMNTFHCICLAGGGQHLSMRWKAITPGDERVWATHVVHLITRCL